MTPAARIMEVTAQIKARLERDAKEREGLRAEIERLRSVAECNGQSAVRLQIEVERLRGVLERAKREYFDNTTTQSECLSNIYSVLCEALRIDGPFIELAVAADAGSGESLGSADNGSEGAS